MQQPEKKPQILLVDDHQEGILAMQSVLQDPRYDLVAVNSGKAALREILKTDFALILMDVQMPVMDGFETAAVIKSRKRSQEIPIIFITAISKDEQFVARGYEAGAVDYLFKPFDPGILRSKVSVFVELHFARKLLERQAGLLLESEIQNRTRLLAEMQVSKLKQYESLANAIPQIVWRADPLGRIEYVNRFWSAFTGLSLEQGRAGGWTAAIEKEDVEVFEEAFAVARETLSDFECEVRIRWNTDGNNYWHLLRGTPERGIGAEVLGWVGSATNIHERKETERELRMAKELSEKVSREKSYFLANVSHELRTPLGAIVGFTECLLDPRVTEASRSEFLGKIQCNAKYLSRIIDDLLNLSKAEAGRLEVEPCAMSVRDLVSEVQSSIAILAERAGLAFAVEIEGGVPDRIWSDPLRIRQVLLNLLGNAVKFTEKGSVTLTVRGQCPSSPGIEFRIRDTGPGIDPAEAAKLFKPFAQLDPTSTRKRGGAGLGLALSKLLAQSLGGDVVLCPREQDRDGSEFCFSLNPPACLPGGTGARPSIAAPGMDMREVEQTMTVLEHQRPNLSGKKVLLVEDSPDIQLVLQRFLEIDGAEIEVASNGVEGMNKALAGDFDLVMMDIQMPEMDGFTATRELRIKGFEKPIIALTAHAMREERERCFQAGCTEHLSKPVDRTALIETIARLTA